MTSMEKRLLQWLSKSMSMYHVLSIKFDMKIDTCVLSQRFFKFWLYRLHRGVCVCNFYEFVCGHQICLPLIYRIGTANLPQFLPWFLLLFEVVWRILLFSFVGMTNVFCCSFFHFRLASVSFLRWNLWISPTFLRRETFSYKSMPFELKTFRSKREKLFGEIKACSSVKKTSGSLYFKIRFPLSARDKEYLVQSRNREYLAQSRDNSSVSVSTVTAQSSVNDNVSHQRKRMRAAKDKVKMEW